MIYAFAHLRRAVRNHCVVFKVLLLSVCLNPQTALAALPNGTAFNGSIPGEFNVSPTGAATYSIPIEVPPGIGGMQPSLSLEYNSQSGNGLLGVGWSLGGLSAISRCPATLAQDGFIDGVDFDSNDRFCLDGQRLVAVSGVYGANGTEYRTEIDSYSKIVSYGQQGSGPALFKVWGKAGQVMEYGSMEDARIEAQGRSDVVVWALNKVFDVVGNYLTVAYVKDATNGQYYPSRIDYAGGTSLAPSFSVRLIYEARSDIQAVYQAGALTKLTVRMKNIQTYMGESRIRDYVVNYDQSSDTSRSRMTGITECLGDGITCLEPISFSWQGQGNGSYTTVGYSSPTDQCLLNCGTWRVGDVNGDGRTDLIHLATNSGLVITWLSQGDGSYTTVGYSSPTDQCLLNCGTWQAGDVNGDGRTDLIHLATNSGLVITWLSQGDGSYTTVGYSSPTDQCLLKCGTWQVGDVNGDGRTDLIHLSSNTGLVITWLSQGDGSYTTVGYSSPTDQCLLKCGAWQVGDVNGDGRTDLIHLSSNTGLVITWLSQGNGSYTTVGYSSPTDQCLLNCGAWQVGDVNGDGRTDLIHLSSNTGLVITWLSRGDGSYTTVGYSSPTDQCLLNCGTWEVGDVNGDGRTDLIHLATNSGLVITWLSQGDGSYTTFGYSSPTDQCLLNCGTWQAGDVNGDGRTDLIHLATNSGLVVTWLSSYLNESIQKITHGLGVVTDISYKHLSDNNIYTKESTSLYPLIDLQTSLYVVASITNSHDGMSNSNSYRYQGLKAHLQGRGFLGFHQVSVTANQTGIISSTTYRQDFPYIGLTESSDTRVVNASSPLNAVINAWSNIQPYPGVYQVHAGINTQQTYELNGSLVSTVTTNNQQYDAYGNPRRIDVTSTGGNETYTKITVNTYDNDAIQWYLGRLLSATVTSTGPPGTETRTSAFEYDNTTGLLTAEIIEPGDPQLMLRTEYGYDAYGNKTSVTVKDSGSNAYPLTTATSATSYDYSQLAAGTYSITSTNAKGHSETQVIDARFGKPLSLIGPNLLTTQWQYDSFGRQVREIRADGTETTQSMVWCDSNCAGVPNAVYKVTSQTTGSAATSVYFDSLGRELRSEAVSLDGRMVYKDTQYNNLGQVTKISRPYFAGDTAQWANFLYDLIGRVWKETTPDGGITETTYNGLTTSVHRYSTNDIYNQTTTRVNNVEGNLIQVIDEANQSTTYAYDPFGNLTRVTDPAYNATVMVYDKRGRKTSMDDPDMGHWEYKYDAAGQLRWQKDAKNQVVTMAYDVLGRMTSRVEPEGTSTWIYDTASMGKGKLFKVTGPNGYVEQYRYDSKGRQDRVTNTIAGSTFNTTTTFDSAGRVNKLTYPSGFILQHLYNSNGYLNKVRNASNTSEVYWTAQESSPDGQITLEQLGNGLQTVRTFDPQSGRMTYLGTYAGSNNVQMLNYDYDAIGNLQSREDVNQNLTETFQYDEFNRLTQSTIAGVGTKTWAYDGLGNIQSKDGYSDYTYGTAGSKPHAVTTARGATYAYDTNGNMTSGAGRTITWNSDNKPTRITKGSTVVDFKYGPDRARYQQIKTTGGVTTTTLYVGKLYEQETKGGITLYKNYISAGGRTVAIRETVSGTSTMKYLHQDHLGSTDVITNASGQVQERSSFDAFGSRRVATTWHDPVGALTSLFSTRGFTGHEQLDDVGLIHMNGRVYDPALGRFLSADPYVKYPAGAQGLNRYSYTDNNPLSRVDPSGYGWFSDKWKSIKGAVKDFFSNPIVQAISAIVAAPWVGLYVGTTFGLSTAAGYALSGFSAGFIASGGNFKAGLFGAATGLAFYGVGNLAEAGRWGLSRTSLAHGVVGGASSVASGGRFKHGFMSGGFTSFSSPVIGTAPGGWVGRTVAAAVVGGTASELGGGKFANGAKSFAFLRLFGEAADYYRRKVRYDIDMGPGGDAVEKGLEGMPVEGANNAGTQGRWVYDSNGRRIIGFLEEGGPVSWLGNKLWGVNATAGFHDTLQISMGNSVWRDVLNVPGMAAAAGVTYSGFIGQAVNAVGPMMVPIRDDDRRGGYQWVMYAP